MSDTLFSYQTTVPASWVDHNQHMNDAEYNRFFSDATDAFISHLGLTQDKIKNLSFTVFTLENHTVYLQEVEEGTEINGEVLLHDFDAKRLHLFIALYNGDKNLCATYEVMLMGMDQETGRPGAFPESIYGTIKDYNLGQNISEIPEQIGRTIGIRRK